MKEQFEYKEEKVYIIKFVTNYGTFEYDLDFTVELQNQSIELLNKLRNFLDVHENKT